jgi:hypothetical protein
LFGECQVNAEGKSLIHPSEIDLSDRQSKCRFDEDDSLWGRVALVKCNVISIYPKSVHAFFRLFLVILCVKERLMV